MKKFLIAIALIIFSTNITQAKVSFIADPQTGNDDTSFSIIKNIPSKPTSTTETSNRLKCNTEGYNRTQCGDGFYLSGRCPYDSKYYRTCCGSEYQLTQEECKRKGGEPGLNNCDGKYTCSF